MEFKHFFKDALFMVLGILTASFGLKSFLLPNSFLDGGVMGISLIVAELTHIRLSYLIVLVNIPFLILAFPSLGRQFAIKSIISIVLLAISVYMIPFYMVTDDKLLIAVFGGFFVGLGIGFAQKGEALSTTDIVYTLLTRWELAKLETEVEKIDSTAFIVMHSIKDAKGGMIKKKPLKK